MSFSMTGYARADSDDGCLWLAVTLRSVNHRFLDLQLRLPPQTEQFEALIRRHVRKHIKRGQLQLNVSLKWKESTATVILNRPFLDACVDAHHKLAKELKLSQDLDLNTILRIPGVLDFESDNSNEHQNRAKLQTVLVETLGRALEELTRNRALEASEIIAEMRQRTLSMKTDLETLRSSLENVIPQFQTRLEERLTNLFGSLQIDPQRLIQEAALLAERSDTSEEVQRLGTHIERLLALIETESELGKKIDFLAQEMYRETNTILSKTNGLSSAALETTEIGLRLKGEIEKIREQAQNLE